MEDLEKLAGVPSGNRVRLYLGSRSPPKEDVYVYHMGEKTFISSSKKEGDARVAISLTPRSRFQGYLILGYDPKPERSGNGQAYSAKRSLKSERPVSVIPRSRKGLA